MKKCTKCGLEKEYTEFNKNKDTSDGFRYDCKLCQRKSNKIYREIKEDKASLKMRVKKYSQTEKGRAAKIKYNHTEKGKATIYAGIRKYAKTDKGKIMKNRVNSRRRYQKQSTPKSMAITAGQWRTILMLFGNSCACCGSRDNITVDHVLPLSKGGLDNVLNIQPLCHTCNSKKKAKIIDYRPIEFLHLFFV